MELRAASSLFLLALLSKVVQRGRGLGREREGWGDRESERAWERKGASPFKYELGI